MWSEKMVKLVLRAFAFFLMKNEKDQFLPITSPHANKNGTRHLSHRFISGKIKGREWLGQMLDPKAT